MKRLTSKVRTPVEPCNGVTFRRAMFDLLDGLPDRPDSPAARVIGFALLGTSPVVLLLRQPGTSPLRSLWAEDGPLFLADAQNHPILDSTFRSYGGYFHLPSRLISELATQFPITSAPAVMSGSAAVVAGLIAWFVFRTSRYHVQSLCVRLLLALAVLVLPAAGREVLANVTNLHWFLLYGAIWAALTPARNTVDTTIGVLVIFAAATADPMTLSLVPLALARYIAWPRWGRQHAVTFAFAVGSVLQTSVMATAVSTSPTHADDSVDVLKVFGGRVVTAATVGESSTFSALERFGWVFVAIVTVLVVVGVAITVRRRSRRTQALVLVFLVAGSSSLLLAIILRWDDSMVPGLGPPNRLGFGERYFVVPHLCLLAAIFFLFEPLVVSRDRRSRVAAIVILLVMTISWGRDFRTPNARAESEEWGRALAQASADCGRAEEVPVAIAPDGWSVNVRCSSLDRGASTR